MKKFINLCMLCMVTMCIVACNKEPFSNTETDGFVAKLSVGEASSPKTKSAQSKPVAKQVGKIAISDQEDPEQLFLIETVESLDDIYYFPTDSDPITKGIPVYTENFVSIYPTFAGIPYSYTAGKKDIQPFDNGKAQTFSCINSDRVIYDHNFGTAWPADKNLLLFLYAPEKISEAGVTFGKDAFTQDPNDTDNGIIKFHYVSPSSDGNDSYVTATALQDILFTSKGTSQKAYEAGSKVLFYHALTGVKFKTANAERESNAESQVTTTIINVTLTNILSEGDCEVTPDQKYNNDNSNITPDVQKSEGATIWSNKKTGKNYTLSGVGVVDKSDATKEFPDSFYGTDSQNYGGYNLNTADYASTFFFIPQKTENCTITIEYSLSNKPGKTFKRTLDFNDQEWKAGCLYTYTLAANMVDALITDDMDTPSADKPTKKDNVVVTNTGNVDVYFRAAIVGNWYDTHNHQQIVAPWTNSANEGEFEGLPGDNWIKGDDGYYYYAFVVKPGMSTHYSLFDSYTVYQYSKENPEYGCPIPLYRPTAHLNLGLAIQAIDASKLSTLPEGLWETDHFKPYGEESSYDPE